MDRHTADSLDHWLTTPPEEYESDEEPAEIAAEIYIRSLPDEYPAEWLDTIAKAFIEGHNKGREQERYDAENERMIAESEAAQAEYDPGPEVDDQGGMSEFYPTTFCTCSHPFFDHAISGQWRAECQTCECRSYETADNDG